MGGMVQGELEVLREGPVPLPPCPPQISAWTDPGVTAQYVKCSYQARIKNCIFMSFGAAKFAHSRDNFFVEVTPSGLALFYGIRVSAAAIFEGDVSA